MLRSVRHPHAKLLDESPQLARKRVPLDLACSATGGVKCKGRIGKASIKHITRLRNKHERTKRKVHCSALAAPPTYHRKRTVSLLTLDMRGVTDAALAPLKAMSTLEASACSTCGTLLRYDFSKLQEDGMRTAPV